jgi:hypothetical protein
MLPSLNGLAWVADKHGALEGLFSLSGLLQADIPT